MSNVADDVDLTRALFAESAARLFADRCDKEVVSAAEEGIWPQALWDDLEEIGLVRAVLPERQNGAGVMLADLLPALRLVGRYAVPVPLAETLVAAWLLDQAELPVPSGPLAFAPVDRRSNISLRRHNSDWMLDGALRHIPWGSRAARVALVVDTVEGAMVASVDPALASMTESVNLADEPRTRLVFEGVTVAAVDVAPAPLGIDAETPYLYGAVVRTQQMAGALAAARDMAVRYTSERVAFGKPLNKLQAVQQNLAVLAGQSAAANVAADMVVDALSNARANLRASVALARVRINEAAEIGARLAHQAHGAIGFTHEHQLHQITRRLWAWRDEFGNDAYWAEQVGRQIIDGGDQQLWNNITHMAQL